MRKMSYIIASSIYLLSAGCNQSQKSPEKQAASPAVEVSSGPAQNDLEVQFFLLADEVQKEVAGGKVLTQKEIRKALIEAADADKDGKISDAEKTALKAKLKEARAAFKAAVIKKFDQNADGKIDKAELKAGLEKIKATIKAEFAAMDQAMMAAHKEAAAKIAKACGMEQDKQPPAAPTKLASSLSLHDQGADDVDNDDMMDDELQTKLDGCKDVIKEEREAMRKLFREKFAEIKEAKAELRALMKSVGKCQEEADAPAKADQAIPAGGK